MIQLLTSHFRTLRVFLVYHKQINQKRNFMRLGFIGTGNITAAIITGLCTDSTPPGEIWVSPRSKAMSEKLSQIYGCVRPGETNQAVIDHTDIIFLAFLPGQEKKILPSLSFREDQVIVTLLAGVPISTIQPLVAPAREIIRAIPLPCTALRTGPIVMYPANKQISEFFSSLGTVIVPDQEKQLEIFSIITALMAPFYAMTHAIVSWGENKGISRELAAQYTGAMFKALSLIVETAPKGDIHPLVVESMTPGGLNETAMKTISDQGGFRHLVAALDKVAVKIELSK